MPSTIGKSGVPTHPTHEVFDSSKIQAFMDCPRGFFYRYILGWEPKARSVHLVFGSAWHEAMEFILQNPDLGKNDKLAGSWAAFNRIWEQETAHDPDFEATKSKNPAQALEALEAYLNRYVYDQDETLHTEVAGTVPVGPNEIVYVKVDSIRQHVGGLRDGQLYSLEHKTTGRKSSSWMDKWHYLFQVGTYNHFLRCWAPEDQKVAGVTINGAILRNTSREFIRIPVYKSDAQMLDYIWHAQHYLQQIRWNMEQLAETSPDDPVLYSFPINSASCSKFGCKFPGLCGLKANPLRSCHRTPMQYEINHWDPRARLEDAKKVVRLEDDEGAGAHSQPDDPQPIDASE